MNVTRNHSLFELLELDENVLLFHRIASTCLSALGIVTNTICMLAIVYSGIIKRLSTVFLINIVLIDFLFSAVTILSAAVKSFTVRSFRDDVWCDAIGYVTNTLLGAEISGLALISANCYAMIVPFNRLRKFFTNKKSVFTMLATSYAVPAIILLLPLFGVWGKFSHGATSAICTAHKGDDYFGTFIICASLSTSFPVIIVSYVGIWITIRKSKRRIEERNTENPFISSIKSQTHISRHRKLVVSVVSMVIAFTVLYFPTGVSHICDPTARKWNKYTHLCLNYMTLSKCVVHTLVYTLTNAGLRKATVDVICCVPCHAKRYGYDVSKSNIHSRPSVNTVTT